MTAFIDLHMNEPAQKESVKVLSKGIGSFDKALNDRLVNALNEAAYVLAERVRETFDVKGARGGHPEWLPNQNPTPLIDTGALQKSIEGLVVEAGDNKLELHIGTDIRYAEIHNEGGDTDLDVVWVPPKNYGKKSNWQHTGRFRPARISQREFLFLTDQDKQELNDLLLVAIDGVFSDSFAEGR